MMLTNWLASNGYVNSITYFITSHGGSGDDDDDV